MATKIITKNSSTASAAPLAADLSAGELAINTNDGKLFYKDSGGTVRTLASKDAAAGTFATLSASGNVTLSGGTANGVAYLNGSKVLTTGSALTFDGTTFAAPFTSLSGNGVVLTVDRTGTGGNDRTNVQFSNSGTVRGGIGTVGAADGIYFNYGTTEGMRLTSTGLGIGTSSPAAKLDVAGDIIGRATTLRFKDSGNTTQYGAIYADSTTFNINAGVNNLLLYSAGTERMRLDSSGNLGLGVTPSAWASFAPVLQIKTPGGGAGAITGSSADNFRMFANTYYDGSYKRYGAGYATQYEQASGTHAWYTAGTSTANSTVTFTQAMTLDASGRLGIGTTSPSVKLQVQDSAGSNPEVRVLDGTVNSQWYAGSNGTCVFGTYSNHPLVFRTNGTEAARIDSSGNLLVGTTSAPTGSTGGSGFIAESVGRRTLKVACTTTSGAGLAEFINPNGIVGTISVSGSTTTYGTSSDYRLKENVQPMQNALGVVAQLKPVTYTWKTDGSAGQGFIAHELQAVVPDCVTGEKDAVDEEGNPIYQGIDTSFLVATLTAAIQEQQAIIEQLKARLDAANL